MVFLSRLLFGEVGKQQLMSLRKSTGHSFQHCRKALEQTNNDVAQAVKWLEKEAVAHGWSKLERSSGRATKEGVFALAGLRNLVAVTEVNCETDFVARNADLRGFVQRISQTLCQDYAKTFHSRMQTITWEGLSKLTVDGATLDEGRARMVSKLGEKLDLRQSLIVAALEGEHIAASCHPDTSFGKYGAIMLYKGGNEEIANKLCRHIIGMKPTSIALKAKSNAKSDVAEETAEKRMQESQGQQVEKTAAPGDSETSNEAEEDSSIHEIIPNDDSRLVCQDFVFDQDKKVAEILKEHNIEITKFWRFQCAEDIVESKD